MNLLDADATSVAHKIRLQEITSLEAVETYIRHLQKVNPYLNGLVEDRFRVARSEAAHADDAIRSGSAKGKLYGVPITMKECFHVEGMKTTGGLTHRKDWISEEDAAIVSKLKVEGAIILGKTNTPTLCFCQESDNKLFGRTNNPWDLSRTAGGSSGGEGALISVGGAAAGIGADVGGSIRFPSHFNGVVGFKSGKGQVPQQGNFPYIDHPLQERMLGIGPMVKSVRDARLIYEVLSSVTPDKKELARMKVEMLPVKMGYPVSEDAKTMLEEVKAILNDDFPVEEAIPPYFYEASQMWQEMMSVDGGSQIAELAFGERKARLYKEYVKELVTGKAELHRYITWALIGTKLFKPSEKRIMELNSLLEEGDQRLHSYLENRILIFPVYHRAAPRHGELYKELFSVRKTFLRYMPYIAYPNVWGLPVLTLPVGNDRNGLPMAIQLISRNGNEDLLFQLGERLESRTRGFVRCTEFDLV